MFPGRVQSELAAAAELVEADRGKGTYERETGGQRIEEGNEIVPKHRPKQHQTDDRINQAQENDMRWHGPEILQAHGQGVPEIPHPDGANRR